MWSSFSSSKWVCCSCFAPIARSFYQLDKRMLKKCISLIRAAFRTNGPEYHAERFAWYSGPFVRKAADLYRLSRTQIRKLEGRKRVNTATEFTTFKSRE